MAPGTNFIEGNFSRDWGGGFGVGGGRENGLGSDSQVSAYNMPDLSTLTCPSWVALHVMAHSFIKLHKAVIHVIILFRIKTNHSQTLPKN